MPLLETQADIIFLAFQEISMKVSTVVTGNSKRSLKWDKVISDVFVSSSAGYRIGGCKALGGVYACVLTKNESIEGLPITFCEPKAVRLGAHGMAANKAGILFGVNVGSYAKLTFIGCHLSAHMEEMEARNQELLQLVTTADADSDYVVLMGDLNYRLGLPFEDAVSLIEEPNYRALMCFDQLTEAKDGNPELAKLEESTITFPPTYKFDVGTDTYDSAPTHRVPSFTDRVLVKTFPPRLSIGVDKKPNIETDIVRCYAPRGNYSTTSFFKTEPPVLNFPERPTTEVYTCQDGKISDHRPVKAVLVVPVPIENPAKLQELEAVKRTKREEMENIALPVLDVPKEFTLTVGTERRVSMKNVGIVFARWEVVLLGQGVKITPTHGTLVPGASVELAVNAMKLSPAPVDVLFNAGDRTIATMTITTVVKSRLRSMIRPRGDAT
jgi:hypothetical protein